MRLFVSLILLILFASALAAQTDPKPSPTPKTDEQEQRVRVFTEEVRLPVVATDAGGHYDAALEADEVLVLEDGAPQQIRSIRHIPSNVLLILDTGGGDNIGLGGLSKKTSTTRDVALRILSLLASGDQFAVVQSSDRAELLQTWTSDKQQVARVLKSKLLSTPEMMLNGRPETTSKMGARVQLEKNFPTNPLPLSLPLWYTPLKTKRWR